MSAPTHELVDHLFRHQSGKMVAALVRLFGTQNLELAEDVVQDVLCQALETWKYGRLPDKPEAWLMQAAKNRAVDVLRSSGRRARLDSQLASRLESEWTLKPTVEASFSESEIEDGVLRLAFSCCDPSLSSDSQVALILKYLCGFSVREIARAFLVGEDTVEKRLTRARTALAEKRELFDVGSAVAVERVDAVLRAIYLLFNEGYHGANELVSVREELCTEALRLALMVANHPRLGSPHARALVALLCLHGARLRSRLDTEFELTPLAEQDRSLWDQTLVQQGLHWLTLAAEGETASEYHYEAAIAGEHALARTLEETNWRAIRGFYDGLFRIQPSAVVALNRAVSIGMSEGAAAGLAALEALEGKSQLSAYPFYPAALAEMHARLGDRNAARHWLEVAVSLARNPSERRLLERKLARVNTSVG